MGNIRFTMNCKFVFSNQKEYENGTLLTKIYKLAQVVSYSR